MNRVTFDGESSEGTMTDVKDWYRDKLPKSMRDGKSTYMHELIQYALVWFLSQSALNKQSGDI